MLENGAYVPLVVVGFQQAVRWELQPPGARTSMAVCQPDTCALFREVAAMREKLAATTQTEHETQTENGHTRLSVI